MRRVDAQAGDLSPWSAVSSEKAEIHCLTGEFSGAGFSLEIDLCLAISFSFLQVQKKTCFKP
jgi:hypothetical protein